MTQIRLGSLNLLHGRSLSDGQVDPARVAQAVAELDVDVLALQEVDRAQPRSGEVDLTAVVAEALGVGPDGARFAAALNGVPGKKWTAATGGLDGDSATSGPAYGIGLVSRLPVRTYNLLRLPAARIVAPVLIPGTRRVIPVRDEPRVALTARVALPGGAELTVASTHLSFVPGWNAVQLRRLCRWLGDEPGPRVLLGDLNLPGRWPTRVSGWTSLGERMTFPTGGPRLQLDHALTDDPTTVRVVEMRAVPLSFSDHRALLVTVEV